ncbi:MAG: histidine phosphatase family protein, partial [Dehalococcoidales bacterium]
QAEQLRDRLANEKIDVIYTSRLRRASATAEIIASRHQLSVIICPELLEINFGKAEGLTFKEIEQLYPELVKAWPTRDLTFRYPGGESLGDLNNRVIKFLERLEKHAPEETILVVAHSGILRLLICHLLKIEPLHSRKLRTVLASLSIVETYPQLAILTLLNDVSHLR